MSDPAHYPVDRYPDRREAPQQRENITQSALQITLACLALAALPLSSWLYITNYVEGHVASELETHDRLSRGTINTFTNDIAQLQEYSHQLCAAARRADPEFSCEARRYRYGRSY